MGRIKPIICSTTASQRPPNIHAVDAGVLPERYGIMFQLYLTVIMPGRADDYLSQPDPHPFDEISGHVIKPLYHNCHSLPDFRSYIVRSKPIN